MGSSSFFLSVVSGRVLICGLIAPWERAGNAISRYLAQGPGGLLVRAGCTPNGARLTVELQKALGDCLAVENTYHAILTFYAEHACRRGVARWPPSSRFISTSILGSTASCAVEIAGCGLDSTGWGTSLDSALSLVSSDAKRLNEKGRKKGIKLTYVAPPKRWPE